MFKSPIFVLVFLLSLYSSCYYDNEEELYPVGQTCDTISVNYYGSIKPIIDSHCSGQSGCHGSDVEFRLNSFSVLKTYIQADSPRFFGSINHSGTYSPMPKNAPKISECEIKKLAKWSSTNFPEN